VVRGRDVYVLDVLHDDGTASPHDKLCRMLFFLGAVRDAGAARVTAVAPYLCYARKDCRTKPRDAVATRYVAQLFEAVGIDRIVVVDVHDLAAYQNSFRCRAEHLEARPFLVDHFVKALGAGPVAVVSPDAGGYKRAERFRRSLARALDREVGMVFVEKSRTETGIVGGAVVGAVDGCTALIVDDMIATGATVVRASEACRARGAVDVQVAATHGLLVGGAPALFGELGPSRVVVTDSLPPPGGDGERERGKLVVVPLAPLLARAIERLHDDASLSELSEI
jgi:ribose-phosphate pyrophosphokinase